MITLREAYRVLREEQKNIEFVLVSSDTSDESFSRFFGEKKRGAVSAIYFCYSQHPDVPRYPRSRTNVVFSAVC